MHAQTRAGWIAAVTYGETATLNIETDQTVEQGTTPRCGNSSIWRADRAAQFPAVNGQVADLVVFAVGTVRGPGVFTVPALRVGNATPSPSAWCGAPRCWRPAAMRCLRGTVLDASQPMCNSRGHGVRLHVAVPLLSQLDRRRHPAPP